MARERLPAERKGWTKLIHLRYRIENGDAVLKIYLTTGEYPDGRLGEIFLKADKAGSTISGLLDALSITASLGLQSGVQVETLVEKWGRMSFEPSGTTGDPDLPRVSSIVDAVARWLRIRYCPAKSAE